MKITLNIKLYILLIIFTFSTYGCYGPTWPSRGLSITGAPTAEVVAVSESVLIANGFKNIGDDGRDKIVGGKNTLYFKRGENLLVVISMDRNNVVPIRINHRHGSSLNEANQIYDLLAIALEERWRGAVVKETAWTKP